MLLLALCRFEREVEHEIGFDPKFEALSEGKQRKQEVVKAGSHKSCSRHLGLLDFAKENSLSLE